MINEKLKMWWETARPKTLPLALASMIVGGMSAIHQFVIVGAHVMLGGGSMVSQDVPPYVMAQGNHARPFGVNLEGLKRRGFDKPTMHVIRNIYKMLYRSGKTLEEVLPEIEQIAETD